MIKWIIKQWHLRQVCDDVGYENVYVTDGNKYCTIKVRGLCYVLENKSIWGHAREKI